MKKVILACVLVIIGVLSSSAQQQADPACVSSCVATYNEAVHMCHLQDQAHGSFYNTCTGNAFTARLACVGNCPLVNTTGGGGGGGPTLLHELFHNWDNINADWDIDWLFLTQEKQTFQAPKCGEPQPMTMRIARINIKKGFEPFA